MNEDVLNRLLVGLKEDKAPDMIAPTKAAREIADALNIRYEAALMLLYGLCATGNVRWSGRSGEIIDEDAITIAAFGDKPVFIAADDVRSHLANWSDQPQPKRKAAVIKALLADLNPPRTTPWKQFCDQVRSECKGWRAAGKPAWGFGDRQIRRAVKDLRAK